MKPAKLVLLFLAFVLASPAGAIFSENFEGATPGYDSTLGVITGTQFSLTAGSIDVNGLAKGSSPAWYPELCRLPASGYCIDTTGGSAPGPGTISTTAPIVFSTPGYYMLSFDLEGWYDTMNGNNTTNADATVRVDLTGLITNAEFEVSGDNPYLTDEILFQVTASNTSATLTFTSLGGNYSYAGGILDNVSIDSSDPVPEPRSVLLFGLGALILAARIRVRP